MMMSHQQQAMVERVDELERMIVRHPEQWWWVHRRWKPWPARATPR